MRTFIHKQMPTLDTKSPSSARSGRAFFVHSQEVNSNLHLQRMIGNQATQPMLQTDAENLEAGSTTPASTRPAGEALDLSTHKFMASRFAHDFSAIPVKLNASSIRIQPKLKIGGANDKYEQEADQVAEQVMRMPEPKSQQSSQADEREELVQLRALNQPQRHPQPDLDEDEEDLLQAKPALGFSPQVTPNIAANIQSLKGGGQPLPENQRRFFESRMGHDFSGVRIHTNSKAANTAQMIQAKAFTLGNNIVFNTGQYSHNNQKGKKLLAHELTHVVQQGGGDSMGLKRTPTTVTDFTINHPVINSLSEHSTSSLIQCSAPIAEADEDQQIVTSLPVTAGSRIYWVELIERSSLYFLRVTLEGTVEKLEVQLIQNVPAGATASLASKTIGPDESNVIISLSHGSTARSYWVKIIPSPYEPAADLNRPDRITLFNGANISGKDFFPHGSTTRLSPSDAQFSTAVALQPSGSARNPAIMVLEFSPRSSGGTWLVLKLQKTGQMARVSLPDASISQGTIRLAGQHNPGQDNRGNERSETNLEFRDSDNNIARQIRVLFTSWISTGSVQEGYTYEINDLTASSEQRGGFTVPPSSTNATNFHTRDLETGDPNVRSTVSGDQTLAVQLTAQQAGGLILEFWRLSPTASQIRFVLTATSFNQRQEFTIPYNKTILRPRILEATGDDEGQLFVNLDGGTSNELILAWHRRATNHEYPFLEGAGHIVLRNVRTSELALMVIGSGMDAWNGRWQNPSLPDNAIAAPKWRRFSNGYETGWISNVSNTWIPDRLLYPQIQGAQIAQMLFEQTAITAIRMIPIVGSIVMIGEAIAGREIITGRRMGNTERWIHGLLGGLVLILEAVLIIRSLSGPARQTQVTSEVTRFRAATGMSEAEARSLLDAGENLSASDRAFVQSAKSELQAGRALDTASAARLQQIVTTMDAELQQARSAMRGVLDARVEQINVARGDLNITRARFRRLSVGGDTAQPLTDVAASVDELLTPFRRVRTVTGGGRGGSGVSTYIESLDSRFSVRITHSQVGASPVGLPAAPRIHIYEGVVSGHGSHIVLPNGTTLSDILTALGL